jgi:hypothetical protein
LCKKNFTHKEESKVIAKIWLIGRSYPAAIERRKNAAGENSDDFYLDVVAPKIINSQIDNRLHSLKIASIDSESSIKEILEVHFFVTQLFNQISGLNKRSLASKYLHFHYPALFFIYDTRAVNGITKFSHLIGRLRKNSYRNVDNEYRKFFNKCIKLRTHIYTEFEVKLTPRQLDNLLLRHNR